MALEAGEFETEAGVLDPKMPLPAVTLPRPAGTRRPVPAGWGAATAPDPWGQEPEEDEKTATGGADPWGQDPEDEETAAGDVDPPEEDDHAGRKGGDAAVERVQDEYAAALDSFLSAEEGSSDYEATLSAVLAREKELLAVIAAEQDEQELTEDERRRVQVCLKERELDPGAADGNFGPRTRTAIRAWQASRDHEETGYLNQSSARTLLEECEVALAEATPETTKAPVVRTFEPKCRALFDGQPSEAIDVLLDKNEMCYLEFDNRPGCHLGVVNDTYSLDHRYAIAGMAISLFSTHIDFWFSGMQTVRGVHINVNWSGGCSEGVPDGQGTISWSQARFRQNGQVNS